MRALLIFVALFVVVCVGSTRLQRCTSHEDCGVGNCCRVFLRGKKRSTTGTCSPNGAENDNCHVNPLFISSGVSVSCPCNEGLECVGTGVYDVPNGELGQCTQEPSSCMTSADCASDECCVDLNRPKGRRRRQSNFVCQKMATIGQSCLVSYGSGQPGNPVFMCPCISGLTCLSNGYSDMPLGPMGTCAALKG